jgi:hypothetical protein
MILCQCDNVGLKKTRLKHSCSSSSCISEELGPWTSCFPLTSFRDLPIKGAGTVAYPLTTCLCRLLAVSLVMSSKWPFVTRNKLDVCIQGKWWCQVAICSSCFTRWSIRVHG